MKRIGCIGLIGLVCGCAGPKLERAGLPAEYGRPVVIRNEIGEPAMILHADGALELREAPELVIRRLVDRQVEMVAEVRKELAGIRGRVAELGREKAALEKRLAASETQ